MMIQILKIGRRDQSFLPMIILISSVMGLFNRLFLFFSLPPVYPLVPLLHSSLFVHIFLLTASFTPLHRRHETRMMQTTARIITEKHATECRTKKALLHVPTAKSSALPHSFSSPELPVPSIDTSTSVSVPLVTLHNTPLASPNNRASDVTDIVFPVPVVRPSIFYNTVDGSQTRLQSKKYGRSHSEMILPGIESCGELSEPARFLRNNPRFKSSSLMLSLHERIPGTGPSDRQSETEKRSRSLSPYLTRCLCYNCNVSELILRSRDLPPVERSNFDTYFVRSLSHKFFNCSCYYNLQETESSGSSYSVSLNDSNGNFKEIPDLDLDPSPVYGKRKSSMKQSFNSSCSKSMFDRCSVCKNQSTSCACNQSMASKGNKKWRFDRNIMFGGGSVVENTYRQNRTLSCPSLNVTCDITHRRWLSCPNVYFQWYDSQIDASDHSSTFYHTSSVHSNDVHDDHDTPRKSNHRSKCPRAPFSRLQPQRSFSSPDTRPSIIQPDPTCTARRHRHSISGQMSYFKLLGYNVNKKLTGSANSLFSTAVISGSSSAPNLKDMVPPHASAVAAIEGFGGVPPIRPLETLHNALSLRQLDSFLEMMTSAPLFRTPASSPPKYPSPGGSTHESVNQNLSIGGISHEYHSSDLEAVRYITPTPIQYKPNEGETCDIRNQLSPTSPNSTGWSSEPQSFLSSEPSSPAPTSTGECSMSISLISNEGVQSCNTGPKFPTTPCLDVDFNEFCINIDQDHREGRGSVSYTDYYSNEDGQIRKCGFGANFNANLQKIMHTDDLPIDNIDDDEDHTITLKQTEEQKKQDVKQIFEQKENSTAKPSGGYKKIGRFLVESMEIADEDVRIKETDNTDKAKSLKNKDNTETEQKKIHSSNSYKRKNFSRSQSVSMPKMTASKPETNYSYKCTTKLSSLSNMSDQDLENWKHSMMESKTNPSEVTLEQPILTVASNITDSSSVTIGFNVQEEKKEQLNH